MPVYVVPHPHQGALAELAEVVHYGFEALKLPNEPMVVLGAHMLQGRRLPWRTSPIIIYNTEHPASEWFGADYRRLLETHRVWDYIDRGIGQYVPIGYMPQMTRIPKPAEQPIDVLFYGSMNNRRLKIIQGLKAAGLNVKAVFGLYGAERDEVIAASKVVLNVHYYTPAVMEIVRLSYLWANSKCVVTECTEDSAGFHYDELVDACVEFVKDDAMRAEAEDRCFRIAKLLHEDDILAEALR